MVYIYLIFYIYVYQLERRISRPWPLVRVAGGVYAALLHLLPKILLKMLFLLISCAL